MTNSERVSALKSKGQTLKLDRADAIRVMQMNPRLAQAIEFYALPPNLLNQIPEN